MASFAYTNAKLLLMKGDLDLDTADLRVALVMSNTTADTTEDAATFGDITTLDEYDGASYARQALGSEATAADNTNNRAEFTAANITFATLGAGTRQAVAALLHVHNATPGLEIPVAYIDTGGFPFAGNGGNVNINWSAEGILQIT